MTFRFLCHGTPPTNFSTTQRSQITKCFALRKGQKLTVTPCQLNSEIGFAIDFPPTRFSLGKVHTTVGCLEKE